jgi:hypothetical protein
LFDLLAWDQAEHVAKEAKLNEAPLGGRASEAGDKDSVSLDEFFAKLGLI